MNENADMQQFDNRAMFRAWLESNYDKSDGIWIVFTKGSKQFTANDALEEALCFGWIDGLMRSIDDETYKKYFTKRKDTKKWSEKNKATYEKLIKSGLMTQAGIDVYQAESKAPKTGVDMSEKIEILRDLLKEDEEILEIFNSKPASRQKQFAGFYCEAKTEETRNKRKAKIVDALRNNYNGMLW